MVYVSISRTLAGLLTAACLVPTVGCESTGGAPTESTSTTGTPDASTTASTTASSGASGGASGGPEVLLDNDPAFPFGPPIAGPKIPDYVITNDLVGQSLFDAFEVMAIDDPTHGTVKYVDSATAWSKGLVSVDGQTGHARIAVESQTVATTTGRESVRLRSKLSFNEGLFLIDVTHLPQGNAVWPSFWTLGAGSWPAGGEIDIIEGVNDASHNSTTLHTSVDCSMAGVDAAATMTGTYGERDCNAGDKDAGMPYLGCGTSGPTGSFGPQLNAAGGGVFAMKRTSESIDVWFWPRASIPADVATGLHPTPATWGLPTSHFALGGACSAGHFSEQRLILNTTLCGDWAGGVFDGPGGKGPWACADYVKGNPSAFKQAFWDIAWLRTFEYQP